MAKLLVNINRIFIQKPLLFIVFFIGLIVFFSNGIQKLNIEEDIFAIFPKKENFKKYQNLLKDSKLNAKVIFSINGNTDFPEEDIEKISKQIAKQHEGLLTNFQLFPNDKELEFVEQVQGNLPYLFDTTNLKKLDQNISDSAIQKAIARVKFQMEENGGIFYQEILSRDPLGLSFPYLKTLERSNNEGIIAQDGLFTNKNQTDFYFFADLNYPISDNVKNKTLNDRLKKLSKEVHFDYFGTFQIANENATQIQKDNFLISLIGIGSIFLLLFLFYRSIFLPFVFILPAVFGALGGLGLVGYIHPTISAISLATSTILFGIILDYSFHFFTHYKHSKNLLETVQAISNPLIIGSFTTVAAFVSLTFTDSVVLQDFGIISFWTLIFAALFTLILLPVLLHYSKFKFSEKNEKEINFILPNWLKKSFVYLALALTLIALFRNNQIHFDGELNNLGFHSPELVQKEKSFTGINPLKEKKFFIFSSSKNTTTSVLNNIKLYQFLKENKEKYNISEITSVAPIYDYRKLSNSPSKLAWDSFWSKHFKQTYAKIENTADANGFQENAFEPFKNWINSNQESKPLSLTDFQLQTFEHTDKEGIHHIITSIVVDKNKLDALKKEIIKIEGVTIYDIEDLAESLLNTVQADFNFLLIFSSLLVFLTLLLIYGRIELALFAFLPMLLSWLWIVFISDVFGLTFNFVNIVIATFIFGLGDDFSIFTTDGLLQKYKTGKSSLKSYQTAIILSALTTIFGTGALYFAKHPSIHSIALISVTGIICVVLVSLIVQPVLFNRLFQKRVNKGKYPLTLFHWLVSVGLFLYFFIGSILLNVLLLFVLTLFFIPKSKKRAFFNYLISKLSKSTIYLGLHVKKRVINRELLDYKNPCIIIANHSSFLDILLTIMLHPKSVIMVKKWVYNSPVFGLFIRYSGYIFAEEGSEEGLLVIEQRIQEGYSVIIFPEGTRSPDGEIKRFKKGAFFLAEKLKLDIQPILILGAYECIPKNDYLIKRGELNLKILPRVKHDDINFGSNYSERTKRFTKYMRQEMNFFREEYANTAFLYPRVQKNYTYKGPVLEWYVRIKWMLEQKNYAFYDQLIANKSKILSIGCGYGYMEYYLHYRNPNRCIIGVDYDEEKIEVAQNIQDKKDNLQFHFEDATKMEIVPQDVYFLNDVLHYFPKEDQYLLLDKIAANLNPDGIIFIRDGVVNQEDRHKNTEYTEKLSTKVFNFNKASHPLCFIDIKEITNFADKWNFSIEIVSHSLKTSNTLFILKNDKAPFV